MSVDDVACRLAQQFVLDSPFTHDTISSFRVAVFPLMSTSPQAFVNAINYLRRNLSSVPLKSRTASIQYYATTHYQLNNMITHTKDQQKLGFQDLLVTPVPSLQISPHQCQLMYKELNQHIIKTESKRHLDNQTYKNHIQLRIDTDAHKFQQVMQFTLPASQYVTFEDLVQMDYFPNHLNCHAYLAIGELQQTNIDQQLFEQVISELQKQFLTLNNEGENTITDIGVLNNNNSNIKLVLFNSEQREYTCSDEMRQILEYKFICLKFEQAIYELINSVYEQLIPTLQDFKRKCFAGTYIQPQSLECFDLRSPQFIDIFYPINKFSNKLAVNDSPELHHYLMARKVGSCTTKINQIVYNYDLCGQIAFKKLNYNYGQVDEDQSTVYCIPPVAQMMEQQYGRYHSNILLAGSVAERQQNEIVFPQNKIVTKQQRQYRYAFQMALALASVNDKGEASQLFKYVYMNCGKTDQVTACFSYIYSQILDRTIDYGQMIKMVDVLMVTGLVNTAMSVLSLLSHEQGVDMLALTQRMLYYSRFQQYNFLQHNQLFSYYLNYYARRGFNAQHSDDMPQSPRPTSKYMPPQATVRAGGGIVELLKLQSVHQLFSKPMLNEHERLCLRIFIQNLRYHGLSAPAFLGFIVQGLSLQHFYQFQQLMLFQPFRSNLDLICSGFYLQAFDVPSRSFEADQQMLRLKRESPLLRLNRSENAFSQLGRSAVGDGPAGSFDEPLRDNYGRMLLECRSELYAHYGDMMQQVQQNYLPVQMFQCQTDTRFYATNYRFDDFKIAFNINQKIKNECNNVHVVLRPYQCKLQTQINQYNTKQITALEYQKLPDKNNAYQQIFINQPIQIQLSFDHRQGVSRFYPYIQLVDLEFNYAIKTQVVSQYFDQNKCSLFVDVQFQLLPDEGYKKLSPQQPKSDATNVAHTNIAYEDILGARVIADDFEQQDSDLSVSHATNMLTNASFYNRQQNVDFVCELFELRQVTLNINGLNFSTQNILNNRFILYNQYVYLNLSNVQNINYIQFESMFGYQFQNLEKQQQSQANLLLFEFTCRYNNVYSFKINTENNIYLFSDISEEIQREKTTFDAEQLMKNNKLRQQSIMRSLLVPMEQASGQHSNDISMLGSLLATRSTSNLFERVGKKSIRQKVTRPQFLTIIDNVTKDKLYLIIQATNKDAQFCFNFKEQVMRVQLSNYFQSVSGNGDAPVPDKRIYNGQFFRTGQSRVYNNFNKLILRKQPTARQSLVYLAQNETINMDRSSQLLETRQYVRDLIAEVNASDLLLSEQDGMLYVQLGETLKNLVQNSKRVSIKGVQTHNCCVLNQLQTHLTASTCMQFSILENYRILIYLKFQDVDLVKLLIIEQ